MSKQRIRFESPVFFCAGEPSGDVYAGLFINHLKKEDPGAHVAGVGGPCMEESGAEPVFNYERLKTFGLSGGLGAFCDNYSMYRKIGRMMLARHPRTFVAVAYPGLNLMLCRVAHASGIRVDYLLPPQIWAWGSIRKYFIKKWVDRVVSVFPFEAEFYQKQGIKTVLVENPLMQRLRGYERTDPKKRIGFMPGSRGVQFRRNLPVIRRLISMIQARNTGTECCIIMFDARDASSVRELSMSSVIYHENRYQMMKNCDLLVTCSGTASLEASLLEVPQVFFHRFTFIDFHVFRRILRLEEYNLCNILHRCEIVPSFVHHDVNALVEWVYKKIDFRLLDPVR
jgi:lipid-A-disaccharide synthase